MTVVQDFFAFIGRLAIGAVLLANGLQKFFQAGISGTAGQYQQLGVPLPAIAAWVSALVEVVGGAALVLGLLLPIFGVIIALEMAGTVLFVTMPHAGGLLTIATYAAVAVGAGALVLGFNGGQWSIDRGLFGRARGRYVPAAKP